MSLPAAQIQRLDNYCQLLWAANQRLNLTRHLDYETFVVRDVIDSLALAEQLSPDLSVLDVGTGGGCREFRLRFCDPIFKFRSVIRPERNVRRSQKLFRSSLSPYPSTRIVSKMSFRLQISTQSWRGQLDRSGKY
ncbi:MAG: hypothetical protein GY768_08060 [Planctomycetaceae bacterium]|nr:hypothetical protein [Planctomycetaceae bacterium]